MFGDMCAPCIEYEDLSEVAHYRKKTKYDSKKVLLKFNNTHSLKNIIFRTSLIIVCAYILSTPGPLHLRFGVANDIKGKNFENINIGKTACKKSYQLVALC